MLDDPQTEKRTTTFASLWFLSPVIKMNWGKRITIIPAALQPGATQQLPDVGHQGVEKLKV